MMDFVVGLPRTASGKDAIWVIVYRLTKTAHFIPIRISFSLDRLAKLYVNVIVSKHGVPASIISDRDRGLHHDFGQNYKVPWGHS